MNSELDKPRRTLSASEDSTQEESEFLAWLEDQRGGEVPGGRQNFERNKDFFEDAFTLWKLFRKAEEFTRANGQDLNVEELKWLYSMMYGSWNDPRLNPPLFVDQPWHTQIINGVGEERAHGLFDQIGQLRFGKIARNGVTVDSIKDWPMWWLYEYDLRTMYKPRDLGKIMILRYPSHTMYLHENINTVVGGFINTVGYREKFGNKIFPNLRMIIGSASFGNMKDLGNLEEVTGWAGFDNQISPAPQKIEVFNIRRIDGTTLSPEEKQRIIDQDIREFGKKEPVSILM